MSFKNGLSSHMPVCMHDEKSHHDTSIRENALLPIMVKIKATCSDDGKKNDTGPQKASTRCLTWKTPRVDDVMPWKLDGNAWNFQSRRKLNKSLMPRNGPFPMKFCLKHSSTTFARTPGIPAWGWRELCACVCSERRKERTNRNKVLSAPRQQLLSSSLPCACNIWAENW
jgi:hypothetical protein